MALRLLFGEGFREGVGTGEIALDVVPEGCNGPCTIGRALQWAGVDVALLDGTRSELPALVILNDRVLGPEERFRSLVGDGDVVRFQLMLTGG